MHMEKKKNTLGFAEIISIIFGAPWIPAVLLVMLYKADLTNDKTLILLITYIVCLIIIPFGYIFLKYKKGDIKDLDLTGRKERLKPLILFCFFYAIALIVTYYAGSEALFRMHIVVFAVICAIAFITFFWKISLHMSTTVFSVIMLNYLYDGKLTYLWIAIPLIFWSRLVLKKHTVSQLIAGFLVTSCITIGGLSMLGLL